MLGNRGTDADQFMVAQDLFSQDDLMFTDGADTASGLGRLRQKQNVTNARGALLQSKATLAPHHGGPLQVYGRGFQG